MYFMLGLRQLYEIMDLKGFAVSLSYDVVLLIHVTCFIMVCTACYCVLLLVEIWSAVVYKFVCLEVRIKVNFRK